jgi:protein SCO1/2
MSPKERSPETRGTRKQHGRDRAPDKAPGAAPARNASPLRLILLVMGAVLLVVLGLLSMRPPSGGPPLPGPTGTAAVGGPFTMIDTEGRTVDQRVLEGRWSLIFFGFTYCPDICPATMTALSAAKNRLGAQGADVQTVFVSIDPERDTPAQLKAYLDSPAFPRPIIGLTGSAEQVAAIAKAYRVYYARNGEGADYLMDHNSAVYLMDPQGRFVRLVRPDAKPEDMAREIGAAMGRS